MLVTKVRKSLRLEGCYLYFDEIEYRWIRSGKAAGRGSNFGIRDDQHAKAAKDPNNNGSEFYRRYPDANDPTLNNTAVLHSNAAIHRN